MAWVYKNSSKMFLSFSLSLSLLPPPLFLGFQNKNRVAILAELDKEKRKLLMQNQSSTNHPGASIALSRASLNKDFRDHAEQQHIAAQQKAALQVSKVEGTLGPLERSRVLEASTVPGLYFSGAVSTKTFHTQLQWFSDVRSSGPEDWKDPYGSNESILCGLTRSSHAHAHSSGYFITQDSAFGNLILPVLPRLDPE
ncbi:hypothetical protein GH733_011318 [Mirounga leonina]|nr:hypothetical protein GH733_011318 [Mirounga leonina]